LIAVKTGVIPQNFLFALARKEIYPESHLFFLQLKPNWIPDKIAFPRLKAGKSDFSGMTNLFKFGWRRRNLVFHGIHEPDGVGFKTALNTRIGF
jgi:hypothetical protein